MESFKLTPADLKKINLGLKECDDICADLDRAEKAGVPNIQYLRDACNQCRTQLVDLKAVYAPNAK